MSIIKSQPPPKVSKRGQLTDEALISRYSGLLHKMHSPKTPIPPPDLLSRPDVLLKIKELRDSIQDCRTERVQSFLNSRSLRHLVQDQLVDVLLKSMRSAKQSERSSLNIGVSEAPGMSRSEETMTHKTVMVREKLPEMKALGDELLSRPVLDDVLTEVEQSALELELLDRQKLRVERRLRSATARTIDSYSSYLNVAEPIYSDTTEFLFQKRWLELNPTHVSVYTASNMDECMLKIAVSNLISIIDEVSDCTALKITYKDNAGDCGMLLDFYTEQAKGRCVEVLRHLATRAGFQYLRSGELPAKNEDDPLERRRTKRLSNFRNSTLNAEKVKDSTVENAKIEEESSEEEIQSVESSEERYYSDEGEEPEGTSTSGLSPQVTHVAREEKWRSLTLMAEELDPKGLVNLLTKGGIFLKYGRRGGPQLRHILVTADLRYIEWRPLNKPHYKQHKGIIVSRVKRVVLGRTTKRFKKFPNPSREEDSLSLICIDRDLDLEVYKPGSGHNQRVWASAFDHLIQGLLSKTEVERFVSKQHKLE